MLFNWQSTFPCLFIVVVPVCEERIWYDLHTHFFHFPVWSPCFPFSHEENLCYHMQQVFHHDSWLIVFSDHVVWTQGPILDTQALFSLEPSTSPVISKMFKFYQYIHRHLISMAIYFILLPQDLIQEKPEYIVFCILKLLQFTSTICTLGLSIQNIKSHAVGCISLKIMFL
jgi:hypothetical protein